MALIWIAAGFILEAAAAQTRNENREHCKVIAVS